MNTDDGNEAKADFDRIYTRPTPHDYFHHLGRLDYSICDEVSPFCTAAASILRRRSGNVRMFDVGCSYGINAATVRHGLSFAELNRLFALNVSRDEARAAADANEALGRIEKPLEISCGGLDASRPAIDFALKSGILDYGVTTDLEAQPDALSTADREWLTDCNLLLCTGAIGYVTDRTLGALLDAMGDGVRESIVLLTVLRVFDTGPIERALARRGLATEVIPDLLLPQRRFEDEKEQRGIVEVLEQHDLDTSLERGGRHFARLMIATGAEHMPQLHRAMRDVAATRPTLAQDPEVSVQSNEGRDASAP